MNPMKLGYEGSGITQPRQAFDAFCVPVDISRGQGKKARVKTPNVSQTKSASGIALRNPLVASRERPWPEANKSTQIGIASAAMPIADRVKSSALPFPIRTAATTISGQKRYQKPPPIAVSCNTSILTSAASNIGRAKRWQQQKTSTPA